MAILEKKAVGLDIGKDTVKVVELASSRGRLRLINFFSKRVERKEGEEEKESISQAVKKLFRENNIKKGEVISALPLSSVVVRNITFPFREVEKIRKAIKFEAESYIPFPIEKAIVDFHIIDGVNPARPVREEFSNGVKNYDIAGSKKDISSEVKGRQTEVLLIAVDKKMVREHLEILQLAEVEPAVIGLDVSAIFNAYCLEAKDERIVAIVDMGADKTTVAVVWEEKLSFMRAITQGGRNITHLLAKEREISFEEAEELKKEEGLTAFVESGIIIKRALEPLFAEIERTFISFQAHSGKEVDEIVLTGGASKLPGLTQHLSHELDVEVSTYCLAGGIEHRLNKASLPFIGVGAGLALEGLGKGKINFNFRKEEFAPRLDWARMKRHLVPTAILTGGIIFLSLFSLLMNLHWREERYQMLNEKIATISREIFPPGYIIPSGMEAALIKRELEEERKEWRILEELTPPGLSPLGIMREIWLRIPEDREVELLSFTMTREAVRIDGNVASFHAVDLLRQELEESPHFERVSLERARTSRDGKTVNFELNIYLLTNPSPFEGRGLR
jgi:type IV pilus assembly protein PilM